MNIDSVLFAFALIDTGFLLFLAIYFIVTLSDLDCDYLNPVQCCSRLNVWIVPEIFAQIVLVIGLLFTGHYILFLINTPFSIWLTYRYHKRINYIEYDPVEIMHRGNLINHYHICISKLFFYLIQFFIHAYCLIISLLTLS